MIRQNKYILSLVEDTICRFCHEKEEILVHVLYYCDNLAKTNFLITMITNIYIKEPLSKRIGVIKKVKLEQIVKQTNTEKIGMKSNPRFVLMR